MASITQQALRILEEEKQVAHVEEQKRIAAAQAEAAAKAQAERSVRVQLQAERELARIAAERALAAEEAAAVQAAEALALQAELERLRARSETDILRDEMEQMRAEQMAMLKAYHLARGEIAELKGLLHALIGVVAKDRGVSIQNGDEINKRLKSYIKAHFSDAPNADSIYMG